MRDLARTAPIMQLLHDLWDKHPQLRLGQLLSNVTHGQWDDPRVLFYMEDDVLEELLRRALAEGL